jgi:hypothetical protein
MFRRALATIVVVAAAWVLCAQPGSAQPAELPVAMCGPAPLFLAIASNVVPRSASVRDLRDLSATAVDIMQSSDTYRLSVRGTRAVSTVSAAAADAPIGSRGSCTFLGPRWKRLVEATSVRGVEVAALAAVVRYGETFQWPLGSVDRSTSATSVVVATLGSYAYVAIMADSPRGTLGCPAVESYRVDPATFEVLPYQEACIEANSIPRVLPRLSDLPSPQ